MRRRRFLPSQKWDGWAEEIPAFAGMEKYDKLLAMTDDIERRRNLTFSQAEGLAELPRQLKREEMPRALRVQVWAVIWEDMDRSIRRNVIVDNILVLQDHWRTVAIQLWIEYFQEPADEFPYDAEGIKERFKKTVLDASYNDVFDFLTKLLRCKKCPPALSQAVAYLLRKHQMAYYLDTSGTPTFMPVSTPEEGEAVRGAMGVMAESGMDGARTHLRKAAEAINHRQYADAVRESISAVESVAKVVSGGEKQTLAPVLKKLEKRGLLSHPALSEAFQKLYGYTSDEEGIRHSLLEKGAANVGVEEAVFMFGACASFCGYLCRKQSKMGK